MTPRTLLEIQLREAAANPANSGLARLLLEAADRIAQQDALIEEISIEFGDES